MISMGWIRTALLIGLSALGLSTARSAVASPVRNETEPALERIQAEAQTPTKFPRWLKPGSGIVVFQGEFRLYYTLGEEIFLMRRGEYQNVLLDLDELEKRREQQGGYLNTRGGRWTLVGVGVGAGAAAVLGIIWVERGAPAPWDW